MALILPSIAKINHHHLKYFQGPLAKNSCGFSHSLSHRTVKHQVTHVHVVLSICSKGCPVLVSLREKDAYVKETFTLADSLFSHHAAQCHLFLNCVTPLVVRVIWIPVSCLSLQPDESLRLLFLHERGGKNP